MIPALVSRIKKRKEAVHELLQLAYYDLIYNEGSFVVFCMRLFEVALRGLDVRNSADALAIVWNVARHPHHRDIRAEVNAIILLEISHWKGGPRKLRRNRSRIALKTLRRLGIRL